MLDIFKNDLFGVIPLTDAINMPVFQPRRIQSLGIFAETGIASLTVAIEKKGDELILVAPSQRGGPGVTLDKGSRSGLALTVPHFEINDAIMAEEVQGVRAFGSEDALEAVQDKVSERLLTHRSNHETTIEYSRVGAISGVVTYADGSSLNLFTTFDVTQETEVAFDLSNANPAKGALRKKCAGVIRTMGGNLGGIPYTGIRALCGNDFFDDLMAHTEVRETFLNNPAAAQLRESYVGPNGEIWGQFEFGGILWENYRGAVGATSFVHTDKVQMFPIGVPGLFRTYFSPADYTETVNTLGKRMYVRQYDMPNGKGVHFDTQTNNLNICTRPKVLMKGKRGS